MYDLKKLVQRACDDSGVLLYDFILINTGGKKKLIVYLDKENTSSETNIGITVSDCTNVSRKISTSLDHLKEDRSNYSLEVSSPGINRQLKVPWHFEKAVGKNVTIQTSKTLNNYEKDGHGKDNYHKCKGELIKADQHKVVVFDGCFRLSIPMTDIKKARLNGQEGFKQKGLRYGS